MQNEKEIREKLELQRFKRHSKKVNKDNKNCLYCNEKLENEYDVFCNKCNIQNITNIRARLISVSILREHFRCISCATILKKAGFLCENCKDDFKKWRKDVEKQNN